MTLTIILVSMAAALLAGWLARGRSRPLVLLAFSALAVYAFQPALPVRHLDFWLPTVTLALVAASWALTAAPEQRSWRANWPAAAILAGIVLLLGLTRFLPFDAFLTASRPPQTFQIVLAILLAAALTGAALWLSRRSAKWLAAAIGLILALFLVLKVPELSYWTSFFFHKLNQQYSGAASAADLRWLGFSYIAFRLIHTIRDRQSGRLPAVTLAEYAAYVIFFPSLTAGPIDRIERFLGDLRRPFALSAEDLTEAGKRLLVGLFKKFVIADALALVALNGTNALQVRTAGWTWILLYAYAFQIFFDFSGYTDIAIGLGRLLGFKLPENFNAPYRKPNLTQFWNNWHMTLTQWFRAYFFNPVTRLLRSTKKPLPIPVVIFVTQIITMALIGLWHGVTANFVLWGLWHGLGLFVHNRWSERTKARFAVLPPRWQTVLNAGGALLTFHFVALGWVFFAMPDLSTSWHVFLKLFGFA
ncbi:MAG: membrane bound O-acyl transferase MBOAT family protein [Anaerolineaceae bacterium]|nr:MAG: membrane bound O-acyl transferase MBOAT family protein [Anaerolineaceae bacterium]